MEKNLTELLNFINGSLCSGGITTHICDDENQTKLHNALIELEKLGMVSRHLEKESYIVWSTITKYKKTNSITWQDQPTEEGHYWFKDKNGIMMARLRKLSFGNEKVEINFMGNLHDYLLRYLDGKWYGPITPPEGE